MQVMHQHRPHLPKFTDRCSVRNKGWALRYSPNGQAPKTLVQHAEGENMDELHRDQRPSSLQCNAWALAVIRIASGLLYLTLIL